MEENKAYAFDRQTAEIVLDEVRRLRGQANDPPAQMPGPAVLSSDIRFVLTPSDGIPAATCETDGDGNRTYTPGHAECDTYFGGYDPDTLDRPITATGYQEEVYNPSCVDAPGGSLQPVWRANDGMLFLLELPENATPRTLKAYDCIQLGSTSGTAKVQRKNSGGEWEDDPAYASPVAIDNSRCLGFAPKDGLFLSLPPAASSPGCNCSGGGSSVPPPPDTWIPLGPAGPILVRVTSPVANGATGTAKVLKTSCSSSCTESLPDTEKQCTVSFCNKTNRKLASESTGSDEKYEDIELTAIGCCWYALEKKRAERIHFTLSQKLCESDSYAMVTSESVKWKDVASWPWEPTQVANPFKHQACNGAVCEGLWDEENHNWYVSDVVRVAKDIVTKVYSSGCDIWQDVIVSASVESCGEGTCSAPKQVKVDPPPAETKHIIESYLTCDGTHMTEHRRESTLARSGWCITVTQGSWTDSPAGCCDCPSSPPPPSSTPPSSPPPPSDSVPPPSDSVPPPSDSVPPPSGSVPPSSLPPCGGVCAWVSYDDASPLPPELTVECSLDGSAKYSWRTPVEGQLSYVLRIADADGNEWDSGCVNVSPDEIGGVTPFHVIGGLLPTPPYTATLMVNNGVDCSGSNVAGLTDEFSCSPGSSAPPSSLPPIYFAMDNEHLIRNCPDCGILRSELSFHLIYDPATTVSICWKLIDVATGNIVVVQGLVGRHRPGADAGPVCSMRSGCRHRLRPVSRGGYGSGEASGCVSARSPDSAVAVRDPGAWGLALDKAYPPLEAGRQGPRPRRSCSPCRATCRHLPLRVLRSSAYLRTNRGCHHAATADHRRDAGRALHL